MQKFVSHFQPGLVYDKETDKYYYMPLVLNVQSAQQSLTYQNNMDLFKQAFKLQNMLMQNSIMPPKNI